MMWIYLIFLHKHLLSDFHKLYFIGTYFNRVFIIESPWNLQYFSCSLMSTYITQYILYVLYKWKNKIFHFFCVKPMLSCTIFSFFSFFSFNYIFLLVISQYFNQYCLGYICLIIMLQLSLIVYFRIFTFFILLSLIIILLVIIITKNILLDILSTY